MTLDILMWLVLDPYVMTFCDVLQETYERDKPWSCSRTPRHVTVLVRVTEADRHALK